MLLKQLDGSDALDGSHDVGWSNARFRTHEQVDVVRHTLHLNQFVVIVLTNLFDDFLDVGFNFAL